MVTYIDSTKALCAEKLQITGTSLGRSLNAMPFLTWLDLRFANWTWYGANGEIAAALSSLGDVNLPRLQRLSVRTASIDENVLKAFLLTHHSTLRYLRLSAITLTQGGRWYSILATMLVAMTSLNEFYFSYLMEDRRHLRLLVNKHDFVGRTAILKGIGDMR
ncbi:hypothetical protein GQ44DRAFT_708254 [Phaeosphaeriaceae sp. PMI808]|nr:hypothetical protein GQ44DRAFT_708254 [Phaeosphaeriaceae sp. PMI808]